jgi:hypothetical protein
MSSLRRWQLGANHPLALQLAADSRLSPTDYADDQVWELLLGVGNSPALALQTRYGGRVGLASLVPMWVHEGRVIYETQAYAKPPIVTAFAPGYLRVQATLTSQLALQAEYWAIESHAIGVQITVSNARTRSQKLRLDLIGHVAASGKELPLNILTLNDQHHALHLGKVGNLNPVVLLHGGSADAARPKVGREWIIGGRKKIVARWVHAGLPDLRDSLALAQHWLQQDWAAHFKRIEQAAQAIPVIETGDEDQDAAIAFAYQQLVQSFLKPDASLPHATFVATRQPNRGFNPPGGSSNYNQEWSGRAPTLEYLTALGIASIDHEIAQDMVRNDLAGQQPDGWIGWKSGLPGQEQDTLCMPILARLAWGIFQYTEDDRFLADVFPQLLRFWERWFAADLDSDRDGVPEWQSESQAGYVYFPTFASGQPWGQGADIGFIESPDLLAYLLSEAISLHEMAYYLRDAASERRIGTRIEELKNALESLWDEARLHYKYRDRDAHITTSSIKVLNDGRGDEEHRPALKLSPANRVIVQVSGGFDHVPAMTLHLTGLSDDGQEASETAQGGDFVWHLGRGVYTSRHVYSTIDRIRLDGLSRVYQVDVRTVDTTRQDINALLPLWSVGIPRERVEALVRLVTDAKHFWRPNGVTMCSAQDPLFDPANATGSGGVWPFWLTLIGEGLIENGYATEAGDLVKRLLAAQIAVLKNNRAFTEFYNSDLPQGLGERGQVGGIVPLHLLLRVLGVRIVSSGKVWAGGLFTWDQPVTITQHGVTVRRSRQDTQVRFPSGYATKLKGNAFQEVIDPNPTVPATDAPIVAEPSPENPPSNQTVSLQVPHDTDD